MANEKLVYNELEKDEEECFRKYFTTPNRNGYVKCEGCILPKYFINIGDRIKKMDIRDDDTWVCSFPKTGTTWAQEMVWCIGNDLNFKAAETLLPLRFPFLERSSLFDNEQLLADHPDITLPPHALDSVGYINNLPSPRFIKTHLPFNLLPEKLQNGSTSAKIIYVARNPRDTCVSYYHHSRLLEGYKGSFEQFAELFLNGNVNFGSFFNHVKGYWQSRNSSKILHLKYEEMKKDLKSVIHITADFMGKTLDKDRVEELLDHLSFSNMKQNKAVNYEGAIRRSKKINSIDEDAAFIRKGQIGEWKEIMNSNLCENFKKIEEEYSREIDYVFST